MMRIHWDSFNTKLTAIHRCLIAVISTVDRKGQGRQMENWEGWEAWQSLLDHLIASRASFEALSRL